MAKDKHGNKRRRYRSPRPHSRSWTHHGDSRRSKRGPSTSSEEGGRSAHTSLYVSGSENRSCSSHHDQGEGSPQSNWMHELGSQGQSTWIYSQMFGVPLHEDCAICNRYFTHGIADTARFHTHVDAQAKSLHSSTDALRELQANMARLEAQAASNEVRAQGLVSRVAELEAEACERESTVLQANTMLVDTQRRLEEAQACITTGTAELAYMQGQLDHMNRFSGHAAASGSNAVEPLNDSSLTVGWGNGDLAQPSTGGWGSNAQDIPPAASKGRWGNVDTAPMQEATARCPAPAPAPISEAPLLPTECRQDDGRARVSGQNHASQPPPARGNHSLRGGVQPDHYSAPGVQARREATRHDNNADISPGECPLGVPLESSLEQIDMIQVWLWINTVAAPLSREDRQLFSTSTLSLMWTPGTFANYHRANLCEEVFDVTHFLGNPTSPDQVLEYWNDTGITLDQAAMFARSYNYRSAAQAHPATRCPACRGTEASITDSAPTASTSGQRNPSTDIPHPTDGDISLSPEALALGQMGMALTVIATAAGLIPPDCNGSIAPSLKPVVDTRSPVDDDHN
ncbi:hypothetical protein JAAARDRAFT_189008 [Jaapia argillacea MUCL 33604]|uniref:Uncharacterized protein n=1 Tax=Jaapia argillacea MUCL 33604 TaxID=933084 RepID=A0A067QIX1_9AGAM|nr:hypothetical protein JAAARDRAFT_189008 [Jaapia argillacea MUCL 33604]